MATSFEDVAVQGSGLSVPLRGGPTAVILTHLARRFHYEIDELRSGDLVGGTQQRRVATPEQSNHLSGTALAIRPGSYPVGQRGNLYPHERVVILYMVAECEGVVRWGADLRTPMEGFFQINLPPADPRVARLATRFGFVDAFDSSTGVGTIDAFHPARRRNAAQFHQGT